MHIDRQEASQQEERFRFRKNAVFHCCVGLCLIEATSFALFSISFLWWFFLGCIIFLMIFFRLSSIAAKKKRWIAFLIVVGHCLFILALVLKSGGIQSPFLVFQPLFSIFLTLLFPNPFIVLPALLLLPAAITFSPPPLEQHGLLIQCGLVFLYACADAIAIYLTHYSISHEEKQSRDILSLQKQLRRLSVIEERSRLSRDMHDGIGASLSGLIIQAEYLILLAKDDAKILSELKELKLCAEEAIDELRRALSLMRNEFDLLSHVQNSCTRFEARYKIPITLTLTGQSPVLSAKEEMTLFRILQEGLSNAAKHAEASLIKVYLDFHHQGFSLQIVDNGKGFDSAQHKGGHYGLLSMKERASHIGAQLKISSETQKGTHLSLSFHH